MPTNMYKGLLLKESLARVEILGSVKVTNVDIKKVSNAVEGQTRSWTFVYFEVDDQQIHLVAEEMSRILKEKWYLNINGKDDVYVVFPERVFRYKKSDADVKQAIKNYGIKAGIPADQLDWSED